MALPPVWADKNEIESWRKAKLARRMGTLSGSRTGCSRFCNRSKSRVCVCVSQCVCVSVCVWCVCVCGVCVWCVCVWSVCVVCVCVVCVVVCLKNTQ